jgi:hypothetical protein
MAINSPWRAVDLTDRLPRDRVYPWGIVDCFGVVVGRFDNREHAQRAADAVNHEVINTK